METVTDPNFDGWLAQDGSGIGDPCAFGSRALASRRRLARIAQEGRKMYRPAPSQRDEYKRTILRVADTIRKWTSENLDSTENRRLELTNDGLVLKVFIRSIRAKELLQRLQHEALPSGFGRPIP